MDSAMILAGDIGGTKTNLGLFSREKTGLKLQSEQSYITKNYSDLGSLVFEFLSSHKAKPESACFGIACPIVDGRCETPNLPWKVSTGELKQRLGIDRVELLNDLQAMAYGIEALPESALASLNSARAEVRGTCAVIAAGTGLGQAALVWQGTDYRVLPSEGGHADFAPRNELEAELLRYLLKKFHRVSYERILSGAGLVNLYQFLKDSKGASEPSWLTESMAKGDPAAAITEAGQAGRNDLCAAALAVFASIYGAQAGNLALTLFATGGVYVGGGIAPKLLTMLKGGAFMKAFTDKGRLSVLLETIPVHVILEPLVPMYGAARYAFLSRK